MRTTVPRPPELRRLHDVVSLRRTRAAEEFDQRPLIGLANIQAATGRLVGATADREHFSPRLRRVSRDGIFEPGDVLFGKLRPSLAKVWVAEFPGRCTPELLVMQPHGIEARFLLYVCLSPAFLEAANASTGGSVLPRVSWKALGELAVPIPDRHHQRAIASFLDRQTARIDTLITAKESFLELLTERKRSLNASEAPRGFEPRVTETAALQTATKQAIDLLKERRSALIGSAVTGQISVEAA